MSASGRGRGRGRGTQKSSEMREPDKNTVDKIHEERASMNCKSEGASGPTPEQFDDAALTTIGEGKEPPAVKELKDTLRGGVQLKDESMGFPTTMYVKGNKKESLLNPSVPPFVPLSNRGSSSNVSGATSKGSGTSFMKYADNGNSSGGSYHSTSTSSSNGSHLNPDSKEFVPTFDNGVPSGLGNGDSSGPGEYEGEELAQGWQGVGDILRGFERASPIDRRDSTSKTVLEAGAEILLKVYSYPGSFNEIGRKFQETLMKNKPSRAAIVNLAEMFIHWGVKAPEVRYSSCRICHLIADFEFDEPKEMFKVVLLSRLKDWHKKVSATLDTDEQKVLYVNFAGFFGEIYAKVEVCGQPMKVIGPLVFTYIEKLLNFGNEGFIREGCQILKLTGNNLMTVDKYAEKINRIVAKLQDLAVDVTLSQTCTLLLMQVLELIGCKWGVAASPIKVTTTGEWTIPSGSSSTKLNKHAAPFVPSELPSEQYEFETVYNYQAAEQPVTRREDWYDFVGDDDSNDYTDGTEPDSKPVADGDEDEVDFDGLDPDIELEMEAFIDEIEEHLMLQDFDPDMH